MSLNQSYCRIWSYSLGQKTPQMPCWAREGALAVLVAEVVLAGSRGKAVVTGYFALVPTRLGAEQHAQVVIDI